MKKNFKFFLIGFLSLFFLLTLIFSISVLKKDFKYAHQSFASYQDPFNWFSYHLKTKIIKSVQNLRVNKKIGLPAKNFYINENFIKEFLNNTPSSTKNWKQGFYLNEDDSVDEIEIRLKGDNPANWFFEKKHWRIKTKKNKLIERQREFEYLPFDFQIYLSGKIANSLDIISPNFKPIELFINEKSQGTYIETENLNESFLRRKKIMPVNLYKGEQILAETIIELENKLKLSLSGNANEVLEKELETANNKLSELTETSEETKDLKQKLLECENQKELLEIEKQKEILELKEQYKQNIIKISELMKKEIVVTQGTGGIMNFLDSILRPLVGVPEEI